MKKSYLALAALLSLAGCATTPATPMEAHLNRYAGAEAVAMNCPAYGGYGSVAQMRGDAQTNLAKAKALGATEADVKKARERVNGNFMGAVFLVGDMQACSSFVNNLAWAGAETPTIQPKPKPKAKG
jgi:hypothetical protein